MARNIGSRVNLKKRVLCWLVVIGFPSDILLDNLVSMGYPTRLLLTLYVVNLFSISEIFLDFSLL